MPDICYEGGIKESSTSSTDLPRMSPIYIHLGRDKIEAVLRGIFVMGSCEYMQLFFKWFMKDFLFAFKMWNKRAPFPEASLTKVPPSPKLPIESATCWNHPDRNWGLEFKKLSSAPIRLGSLSKSLILLGWERWDLCSWNIYQISMWEVFSLLYLN